MLATLGILAGCGGSDLPADSAPSQTPSRSVSPSPTISALSATDYQDALTGADGELGPVFQLIGLATTPEDLSAALQDAADAVDEQTGVLDDLIAPTAAESAHADLVEALESLSSDLVGLASDASSQQICTAGTGIPRVGRSDGAEAVRTAAAALDAANPGTGFTVGAFLPASVPDPERRPENGDLVPGGRGGEGELTISNGQSVDAVVKVTSGGQVIRQAYTRANSDLTINGIPDGVYELFVTSGSDWDSERFTRDCDFSKFDDPFDFTTDATSYSTWEITLEPVVGGNASSSDVDPGAFPGS